MGDAVIASVLIANRGEIAVRIARTCRSLGIRTVAVCSDADADARHVAACDTAVRLPGSAPADTYLRIDLLVDAARRAGADAVHPGYGFLAESSAFARAVLDADLTWIGPSPAAIDAMGSKIGAKALMRDAGVPVLADSSVEGAADPAAIGFPLLVKASAGGGGRGMRIVRAAAELTDALAAAEREAAAAFGDGTVFCERYVDRGRHVEVQILGDADGRIVALPERECSVQRRHQKIIEESPSPAVDDELRARLQATAVAAAAAVDYVGAGTVELLLDDDGDYWFLEMNTRLQVEHPVTEAITGIDLVEWQLRIAEGASLADLPEPHIDGWAIEARLTAEDPAADYRPSTGTFTAFDVAGDVRVDTGIGAGSTISPFYDSMVAKVIAHAPTRDAAIRRLAGALRGARLHGPVTNRDQLLNVLEHPLFRAGEVHTGFLDAEPCATPRRGDVSLLAVAAAFAERSANRARASVLAGVPVGWRNNPAVEPTVTFLLEDAPITVGCRAGRSPLVRVDGEVVDVELVGTGDGTVVLLVGGVERRYTVGAAGDHRFVDGDDGHVTFTLVPRHPEPDAADVAGSLAAPMPGSVLRVLVGLGDAVRAGDPLVVVEAMKMEHQITAAADGTVSEVFVAVGDQVETGQTLLVVDEIG